MRDGDKNIQTRTSRSRLQRTYALPYPDWINNGKNKGTETNDMHGNMPGCCAANCNGTVPLT